MVVLVILLFTAYVHFTRSYSFFSKYWTYYRTQLVPIWCHFITLCHSRFFFKTALCTILSFTNQAKGKEPPCRCTFSKSFQRKIPERHFFDHSSTTDASLAHVQDWGAIFKLVCHDQSISGSQKTLWKTKQKLHFNRVVFNVNY